jgi:hypothetical protein
MMDSFLTSRSRANLLAAGFAVALLQPANALDSKEEMFAMAATGLTLMTLMCRNYTPLSDVLRYIGKQSIGEVKTDRITKATAAELVSRMRRGGMLDLKAPDPAAFDPEVSKVTDEIADGFLEHYDADKVLACRTIGDLAVKQGFAEKRKE